MGRHDHSVTYILSDVKQRLAGVAFKTVGDIYPAPVMGCAIPSLVQELAPAAYHFQLLALAIALHC
jgi:hypothetical protein